MRDNLFNDGWRDPGDDLHRMVYYLSWALGFLGGLGLVVYSIGLIARQGVIQVETWPGYHSPIPGLPILFFILGLLFMLRTGLKMYPEIDRVRRIRKKKPTADAIVAGGFLAGFALILLGLERMMWADGRPARVAVLIIAGSIVLAASLLGGLAIAYLPKLSIPKTINNATVESRYGIDKKLMEVFDHPNPTQEGCVAMVLLRTPDGRVLKLRAGATAYDLAAPGMRGTAQIAGSRLKSFKPTRRT